MLRTNPDSVRSCHCFRVFRLNFASDLFNLIIVKHNETRLGVEPRTLPSWSSLKPRPKPLRHAADIAVGGNMYSSMSNCSSMPIENHTLFNSGQTFDSPDRLFLAVLL